MLSPKEQKAVDALTEYHAAHTVWPTVRALADHMETRFHRAERFSDDEVRGDLERAQAKGALDQFRDEGDRVRYCLKGQAPLPE